MTKEQAIDFAELLITAGCEPFTAQELANSCAFAGMSVRESILWAGREFRGGNFPTIKRPEPSERTRALIEALKESLR